MSRTHVPLAEESLDVATAPAPPERTARPAPGMLDGAAAAMGARILQRKLIQRARDRGLAQEAAQAPIAAPSSGGEALPPAVQARMERALNTDLSAVRVHQGEAAPAIGAEAFTQGTDIHFAPGRYQPHSSAGQELLGHELAHVAQQAQGRVAAPAQGGLINDDPALETEADQLGARAARGEGPAAQGGERRAAQAQPGAAVQGRLLKGSALNDLYKILMKNMRAGNFSLVLFAVKARVKAGEVDKEDLDDIADLQGTMAHELVGLSFTHFSEAMGDPAFDTMNSFASEVKKLKPEALEPKKVDELDKEGEGEVKPSVADEGFTELCPGPGKKRVQVPNDQAAGVELKPLDSIRWSQSDVKGSTQEGAAVTEVIGHMVKGGWRGGPASVVQLGQKVTLRGYELDTGQPGGLTSQDNRRLLAAMTAGLPQVPCKIAASSDPLPVTWAVEHRDKLRKTLYWDTQDKTYRVGNSGDGFSSKGKPLSATRFQVLLPKDHRATTYGELIIIRSANQPGVAAVPEDDNQFPVGGSHEAPYLKE